MSSFRFTPEIEAALSLERSVAISAGAGSGKTTALVAFCLSALQCLLRQGKEGEIVAITFTRLAAQELSQRLQVAVEERLEESKGTPDESIWLKALELLPRLSIGTIHSFAARLLREHAGQLGVDPDFRTLEAAAADELRRRVVRASIAAALDKGDLAVRDLAIGWGIEGSAFGLLSAVERLMLQRSARGLTEPPRPHLVSPEAVAGIEDEIRKLAAELVAWGGRTPGTKKSVEGLKEQLSRAQDVLALTPFIPKRLNDSDPTEVHSAAARMGQLLTELPLLFADISAVPQRQALARLVADAERRYADEKRLADLLDFDDLLIRARDLLKRDRRLRQELRLRFPVLLVDEYQDVSALQQELFAALCSGEEGELMPGRWVAVGDLKQSIYRFRGAEVENFEQLIERFGGSPHAVALRLPHNRRSHPSLVTFVNQVFTAEPQLLSGASADRKLGPGFGESDRLLPLRPESEPIAGRVALLWPPADGEAPSPSPKLHSEAASIREAAALATHLSEMVRRGEVLPSEVAILFRSAARMELFQRALIARGLPATMERSQLYRAAEVRDLAEWCASLSDPTDRVALVALLRSPACILSDASLLRLASANGGLASLLNDTEPLAKQLDSLVPDSDEREDLKRFLRCWQELRASSDELPPRSLLERAIAKLDIEPVLAAGPEGRRHIENLNQALANIEDWHSQGDGLAVIAARLRRLAHDQERVFSPASKNAEAISLLTIHAAKGLEWPLVVLADVDAVLPHEGARAVQLPDGSITSQLWNAAIETSEKSASLERWRESEKQMHGFEQNRLLYVALTRAKERLIISGKTSNKLGNAVGKSEGNADHEQIKKGRRSSWRSQIELAAEACKRLVTYPPLRQEVVQKLEKGSSPLLVQRTELKLPYTSPSYRVAAPRSPAAIEVSVTSLLHRFQAERLKMKGEEQSTAEGDGSRRGSLAHLLLAEVDLAAPLPRLRDELFATASRGGFGRKPETAQVSEVVADVLEYLASDAGQRLVDRYQRGMVKREVPFRLRLPSTRPGRPTYQVVGVLDVLVEDASAGTLEIIDYKYSPASEALFEHHRFQLFTYALAAAEQFPAHSLRLTVQPLLRRQREIPGGTAGGNGREPTLEVRPAEVAAWRATLISRLGDAAFSLPATLAVP